MTKINRGSIAHPKALVLEDQVCYEVWPEYFIAQAKKLQVGFSRELCPIHRHQESHPMPGCTECYQVYTDLLKIAEWLKPKEQRPSQYEVEPFDRALHESARQGFRPDVTLTIKILRRDGFDEPVDDCKKRCLEEMVLRLSELGATQGR